MRIPPRLSAEEYAERKPGGLVITAFAEGMPRDNTSTLVFTEKTQVLMSHQALDVLLGGTQDYHHVIARGGPSGAATPLAKQMQQMMIWCVSSVHA